MYIFYMRIFANQGFSKIRILPTLPIISAKTFNLFSIKTFLKLGMFKKKDEIGRILKKEFVLTLCNNV